MKNVIVMFAVLGLGSSVYASNSNFNGKVVLSTIEGTQQALLHVTGEAAAALFLSMSDVSTEFQDLGNGDSAFIRKGKNLMCTVFRQKAKDTSYCAIGVESLAKGKISAAE